MTLSIDQYAPFDSGHPGALGAVASFSFLEQLAKAQIGIRDAVTGAKALFEGGNLVNWFTVADEHWFDQNGGIGRRFVMTTSRPIQSFPFTIVARVRVAATTSNPLIALYNSLDTTKLIAVDASTTFRCVVRNAGATINATDYLALAGPAPTVNQAYTVIFSMWGGSSDHCKAWFQRDGQVKTTHVPGTSFSVAFPAGIDSFAIGGLDTSNTMNGRVGSIRVMRFGMTDSLADRILIDPVTWFRAPRLARRRETIGAVPVELLKGKASVGSILVR